MKKKIALILSLISTIVVATAAAISFSYASYVYNTRFETPVDFNTGLLKSYFEGGSGTSGDPYTISTPDHLRSLQKLNILGVFNENTHFQLSNNIATAGMDWSGDDLRPIGSEDYPFYSQFDGNGKRINNLVVNGGQTSDIGMFGYTSMGSSVTDFILSAPTIKVTSENNPDHESNANPMAELFSHPTTGAASLQLTLTRKSGSTSAYFTTNQSTITAGGVTYDIYYKSTNTDRLYYNSSNNRWIVQAPSGAKSGEYFPVQLTARVYGVYENKIISYLLERWHINVTHDNNVNILDAANNINPGHWKTMHAGVDEGMGPHETYVGFFIGHLDGETRHLGLYGGTSKSATNNAKLIVEGRPVSSFTTLIGRSVNDNVKDDSNATFAQRYFNFPEIIGVDENGNPIPPNIAAENFTLPTYPTAHGQIANYMTTTNNRAVNMSKYYGLSDAEAGYIRFYPTLSNGVATYGSLSEPALSYDNKALTGYVYSTKGGILNLGRKNENFTLNNAMWIYMTSESLPGGWRNLFSRTDQRYEGKIKITYVSSGSENNKFQILYNAYDPTATGSWLNYPSKVSEDYWVDLSSKSDDDGPLYYPNDHPIIMKDEFGNPLTNQIVEQEINFNINVSKMGFTGDFHAMIGLVVGKTGTLTNTQDFASSDNRLTKSIFSIDSFSLKILELNLFFTSKEGGLSRQINSVDYISAIPTYSAGTWSNWSRDSGVRVYFDVGSNITSPGTSASYYFYRTASAFLSSSRVYGNSTLSNSAWQLQNTSGFATATIGTM